LIVLAGCPKDITVVEDSTEDNDYLKNKAKGNPKAVRAKSKQEMVDNVSKKLGKDDCIRTLKIIGHGAPGVISVGAGQGWGDCKEINGNDDWKTVLAPLKGKFCKDGRIILIGCNVGACDAGRDKLKELADYFGVPVEAPTGKTYGDCSEEAGSVHQVAYPDQEKPAHKPSPSDEKKKKKPTGEQRIPFDVDAIEGIAVYSPKLLPETKERIEYDFTDSVNVRRFISGIDFSEAIDGFGLGARYNAFLFIKLNGVVNEYRICSDYDYFLAKGDWKNMYEISWDLEQELERLVEQKLKKK
jgi:hypothetical protein